MSYVLRFLREWWLCDTRLTCFPLALPFYNSFHFESVWDMNMISSKKILHFWFNCVIVFHFPPRKQFLIRDYLKQCWWNCSLASMLFIDMQDIYWLSGLSEILICGFVFFLSCIYFYFICFLFLLRDCFIHFLEMIKVLFEWWHHQWLSRKGNEQCYWEFHSHASYSTSPHPPK